MKADRRARLLELAARLFAERGYHAVSIEELGAAAGVSGPALYRHFSGKQDVLAHLLVGVSRRLLDGGRAVVDDAGSDEQALAALVAFHTDFALTDPDLIRVQDRDLASLNVAEGRLVRRLQRSYVELWVAVLERLDPGLDRATARVMAHATFGLLNSTPYSVGARDREASRPLLEGMALAVLRFRPVP